MLVLPCQVEKFVNCESTPNLSVTAEGNSFGENAYAVHWILLVVSNCATLPTREVC